MAYGSFLVDTYSAFCHILVEVDAMVAVRIVSDSSDAKCMESEIYILFIILRCFDSHEEILVD